MIEPVLPILRCPDCGAPLAAADRAVRCGRGHSFDLARQGYLSLLRGDARLGTADTAEMVAARAAFLGAGHFDPLREALVEECEAALAGRPDGAVVDVGAGTGWYLAAVLDRLTARVGVALDLSKHALRRAARAHPRAGAVACDAWHSLPLADGAAALALSVFAPRNGAETARMLRPHGALVVAAPTARHLGELVSALGLLSVDARKRERLAAQLEPHLAPASKREISWPLRLGLDDVRNAVRMGPSGVRVGSVELEERLAGLRAPVEVTASVELSVWRRA